MLAWDRISVPGICSCHLILISLGKQLCMEAFQLSCMSALNCQLSQVLMSVVDYSLVDLELGAEADAP